MRMPAAGLMLAIIVIWGLNYPMGRYALTHGFAPLSYAATRFSLAAARFCLLTLHRERTLRVRRSDLLLLVTCAGVGIVVNQIAFVYALTLSSASTVALLFGTLPVFVAVFSRLGRVEPIAGRAWFAALVSLAGAALVAVGARSQLSGDLGGVLLALLAAACLAFYSVSARPLTSGYSPYRLNALLTLLASFGLLVAGSRQLAQQNWSQVSLLSWGAFLYGLFPAYVLSNIIWLTAIKRIGASRTSLYANMAPFAGAGFSLLLLSETLTAVQVVGGGMIAIGILLSEWPGTPVAPAE